MTEITCWPLDNHEYTAEALGAAYAARSRGALNATDFAATTNGDNTLTIAPGVACLHPGTYWAAFAYLAQSTTLKLENADGAFPRWDAVALVYDKNANMAGLEVRTGLAAESPALPELRRNEDYDEIFLYRVTRPVGADKITADNVVDLRIDSACCGLMRDTIDAVDTSVMQKNFAAFLQNQSDTLAAFEADNYAAFTAWFDAMKGQLSEDAAGNLQLKIDDLQKQIDIMTHKYAVPAWTGNCYTGYAVMEP